MLTTETRISELQNALDLCKEDLRKSYAETPNKTAMTRSRSGLQDLRTLCGNIRAEILEKRKAMPVAPRPTQGQP